MNWLKTIFKGLRMSSTKASQADFEAWKAMGQGGTPKTWSGYLSAIGAEAIAFTDTMTPDIYKNPREFAMGWNRASGAQKNAAKRAYLHGPLPQRQGPQSQAKRFVYPQREKNADEPLAPEIKQTYQQLFTQLASSNNGTHLKTSVLEKQGTALFIAGKPTPLASPTCGEICHIHESDHSGHVTLSFPDAIEVISKGWGERHRLSGTDWIHLGYTMLYVPRNVEECHVFTRIMQAGVDFMKAA